MVVLVVTGTRRWSAKLVEIVHGALKAHPTDGAILFHGGATGADEVAARYGLMAGWDVCAIPYFSTLGARGGPLRNRVLADAAHTAAANADLPLVAYAFPDAESRGTYDCIRALESRGIRVDVRRVP